MFRHEMAEEAGLISQAFGREEQDRYVKAIVEYRKFVFHWIYEIFRTAHLNCSAALFVELE